MKYAKCVLIVVLLHVITISLSAEEVLSARQVVERMALLADEMDLAAREWGYWQESIQKKLDSKNHVSDQEKKLRRTVWLEGKPYMELVKVNDRDPDAGEQKREADRRAKFVKAVKDPDQKDPEDEDPTWKQLMQKYEFELLPSDGQAAYLVSFRPGNSRATEKTRMDKVFNNLTGILWIDQNFHLLRATANLTGRVSFGLGVVAKLEKLELDYRLQEHEGIWLPARLDLRFAARLLLLKSERQEATLRYFDPFLRPKS